MSKIDRVEIHGFWFEIENLGLIGQKAQGVGNFAYQGQQDPLQPLCRGDPLR